MRIDHNLFGLFVLIVVAIARVMKNASDNWREDHPQRKRPVPRGADSMAEAQRKLLEALGNPPGAAPPAKARPRTDLPPRPIAPIKPPASFTATGRGLWERTREKVKTAIPSRPVPANEPAVWIEKETEQVAVAPALRPFPAAPNPAVATPWRQMMSSPDNLKKAIILREVFGPPRGLVGAEIDR